MADAGSDEVAILRGVLSSRAHWRGRRLVLHAGTPKTGTTSLQYFLHAYRDILAKSGIAYPKHGIAPSEVPKHQWVVQHLRARQGAAFAGTVAATLDETSSDSHTIILSSEGIYNHWWDFGASRKLLAALGEFFDLSCLLWFRDPPSFCRSAYIQSLKNPPMRSCEHYGSILSIDDILELPSFVRLLGYEATLADMRSWLGPENVFAFAHGSDLVSQFLGLLGVNFDGDSPARRNDSKMTATGVELLRTLNGETLDFDMRRAALARILEIDALLSRTARPFELGDHTIAKIRSICPVTPQSLREMNTHSLRRWAARYPALRL